MPLGNWKAEWESCKDEFKSLTGQKKPDAVKIGKLAVAHKASIAGKLKKADETYATYRDSITALQNGKQKAEKVTENLNKFGIAVKEAKAAMDDYDKTLGGQIAALKAKDEKDLLYKSLKLMSKELAAIKADLELGQSELFGKFNMVKAILAREAAKQADLTTEEKVQISTDPMIKKSLQANCAKGKVWIAKCAALLKKTPADLTEPLNFFNGGIQKTARDITQPLTNSKKRLGARFPANVANAEADFVQRNSGNFSLAANTTAAAMAAELKTLSGHIKVIEAWADTNL